MPRLNMKVMQDDKELMRKMKVITSSGSFVGSGGVTTKPPMRPFHMNKQQAAIATKKVDHTAMIASFFGSSSDNKTSADNSTAQQQQVSASQLQNSTAGNANTTANTSMFRNIVVSIDLSEGDQSVDCDREPLRI